MEATTTIRDLPHEKTPALAGPGVLVRLPLLVGALLLSACGSDGTAVDPDMGAIAIDMATPTGEDGGPGDAFTPPACDPESCANGSCAGDLCECEAGWTGELCDALDAPTETGIAFWFDADAADTMTMVDGEEEQLDRWDSRVGEMWVGAQLVDEHPRVLTGGASFANGRPTVTFDGTDDRLTGVWSAGGTTEYTVFAAYSAMGGNESVLDITTQFSNEILRFRFGGAVDPFQVQATVEDGEAETESILSTAGNASLGEIVVVAVRVSESEVTFWRDGAEASTIALDSPLYGDGFDTPFVTLGSTDGSLGATELYSGSLAEVIAFDGAVTDEMLEAVSAYLDAKWR